MIIVNWREIWCLFGVYSGVWCSFGVCERGNKVVRKYEKYTICTDKRTYLRVISSVIQSCTFKSVHWGSRSRRFKSCHSDHKPAFSLERAGFFCLKLTGANNHDTIRVYITCLMCKRGDFDEKATMRYACRDIFCFRAVCVHKFRTIAGNHPFGNTSGAQLIFSGCIHHPPSAGCRKYRD